MKNIYAIVTLMLCVLFVGCSDDDGNAGVQSLRVVSSDVSFDCKGGTGSIHVESYSTISASSTEEWCQLSVKESVIDMTISPNLLIGSRSAMVVIRAGEEETRVPVYQLGDIFDTDLKNTDFTAKGGELTFRVKSNWDVSFENIDETWITCTYSAEDEQVTVKALPLTEGGKYRMNTVKVKSGTHEFPITFTQVNMAGKYACYMNGGSGGYGTCLIEETETDFLYKITPAGSAYDAPYYAKCRNGQFVIYFGQYLGVSSNASFPRVYLCSYDKAGRLSWNTSIEYVAPLDAVYSNGQMFLVFKDNGTWSGQKVDGFYYGLFTDLLENGGTTTGSGLAAVTDLVWLKVEDE